MKRVRNVTTPHRILPKNNLSIEFGVDNEGKKFEETTHEISFVLEVKQKSDLYRDYSLICGTTITLLNWGTHPH